MIGGAPYLDGLDPPYTDDTARYYAYIQCPFCCDTKSNHESKLGWFGAFSSVTFEDEKTPDACSRYAVSWISFIWVTIMRLIWVFVCYRYLVIFRSRVQSNLAADPVDSSSDRAASVQIDDFSPLAHISDAQLFE